MPFGEFQVHSFAPSDNCSMYHSHSQRVGCFWGGPEFHIHVFQTITSRGGRIPDAYSC